MVPQAIVGELLAHASLLDDPRMLCQDAECPACAEKIRQATLLRRAAQVIGDGLRSLAELADAPASKAGPVDSGCGFDSHGSDQSEED